MSFPRATTEPRPMERLEGQLLAIRYRHANGWCIGQATLNAQSTQVVGHVLSTIPLRKPQVFYGYWVTHPQYGRQFQVQATRTPEPFTPSGIVRYLATIHCPHLGPKTARKLVDALGSETLLVLREHPDQVAALPRISAQRARQWQQFFTNQHDQEEIVVWLLQWDIDPTVARRLFDHHGAKALDYVQTNPYALTQNTWGIGFHVADRMALSLGWEPLSPERLEAVWRFGLQTALTQGDCYQTTAQLQHQAETLLTDQDAETVRTALTAGADRFAQLPDLWVDHDQWRLIWVDRLERRLAHAIHTHHRASATDVPIDWSWLEAQTHVHYDAAQQEALLGTLHHPFSIITGGPGTGKTTILHGLLTWLTQRADVPATAIALAAPTARAAQRMTAVTHHPAQTMHRLLEWSAIDHGFTRHADRPLAVTWLIVDEVSMVDLPLADALWQAIGPNTQVLWIGDEHQLPSVGPGSILKDVIASGQVPVFRLHRNFRSTSGISVAAHHLLAGRVIQANDEVAITRYAKGVEKASVQAALLNQVQSAHADGIPWDAMQILTPIHRGLLGTEALNPPLRDLMNPQPDSAPSFTAQGGQTFRSGDRVMQTRNAYAKNVVNGDLGFVQAIRPDPEDGDDAAPKLWVQFPDHVVTFTTEDARHLQLAYAMTVHKSQGSEYPVVFFPLFYDAFVTLHRNLVYTAITRAKRRLYLFTEASAIWLALRRGDGAARQTTLTERLTESS